MSRNVTITFTAAIALGFYMLGGILPQALNGNIHSSDVVMVIGMSLFYILLLPGIIYLILWFGGNKLGFPDKHLPLGKTGMPIIITLSIAALVGGITTSMNSVKDGTASNNTGGNTVSSCEGKLAEYKELMNLKYYSLASLKLIGCSVSFPEKYKNLADEAEVKSYEQVINDKNKSTTNRLDNLNKLIERFPLQSEKYEGLKKSLSVAVEKERKASEIKIANLKKSQGVAIGMTQEEVLASSWGKPIKVNKTTTARRLSEQWVYGSGSYLYFESGLLVSIQH
jgi:hypothetical protein